MADEARIDRAHRRLMVEVFVLAWTDIVEGNEWADDARAFLASKGAASVAEALHLDPDRLANVAACEDATDLLAHCITMNEAARILEMKPVSLYSNWVWRRQTLSMVKVGRRRLFFRDQIEALAARKAA